MTYFEYLKCIIGAGNTTEYDDLFLILFTTEFKLSEAHFCEGDRNRIDDALALRKEWMFEDPHPIMNIKDINNLDCTDSFVSVFEVLIAFARRIENDFLYDPSEGDRTGLWLLTMLQNLGIAKYNYKLRPVDVIDIQERLRVFVEREYSEDGSGGIFPLNDRICDADAKQIDLRNVQLWDQMTAYLRENYV
jgi:hypothetical protein